MFDKKCFLIFSMPLHHSFPSKSIKSLQFFLDISKYFPQFSIFASIFHICSLLSAVFPCFPRDFPSFLRAKRFTPRRCLRRATDPAWTRTGPPCRRARRRPPAARRRKSWPGWLQLWPEIPVISTNKTSFIECIIPIIAVITSYN